MRYPSVTEVLGKYSDFSNVPPERLEAACERGKAVHAYCASYALGVWSPKIEGAEGYCNSFLSWFNEYVEEVLLVEEELVDEVLGFVGHPDLVVRLRGDVLATVPDLKTPITLNPIWAAQIAAYLHLALIRFPKKVGRGGSLRLDPKGRPAKFKDYNDTGRDLQAFLSALYAHKYFTKGGR